MCDFDSYPTLYSAKIVRARKPHKCCECGQSIEVGTHYQRAVGVWDEFSTFKTCLECQRLIDFIYAKYPEEAECMAHGGLRITLREIEGLILSSDELYQDEPVKVFANCTIVSSVPWLKRVNGVWRLVDMAEENAA